MQIVNGYVCQTGCDVAAAKKGHDPKNPHDDPMKAEALAEAKGLASGRDATRGGVDVAAQTGFAAEAVQFGGALAQATRTAVSTVTAGSSSALVDRLA